MATMASKLNFSDNGAAKGALAGVGAGFALGLLAAVGRKFAVQAPTTLAGSWDEALKLEHRMTLKIFDKLEKTRAKDNAKRTMLLTQLKHALGKHAFQEENAIYPALRDAGLATEADQLNTEHGYVKQYLYDLETLVSDNGAFQHKLRYFRSDIEKHIREEEDQLFPRLKQKLSAEANKTLTQRMNKEGLKLA